MQPVLDSPAAQQVTAELPQSPAEDFEYMQLICDQVSQAALLGCMLDICASFYS